MASALLPSLPRRPSTHAARGRPPVSPAEHAGHVWQVPFPASACVVQFVGYGSSAVLPCLVGGFPWWRDRPIRYGRHSPRATGGTYSSSSGSGRWTVSPNSADRYTAISISITA